MLYLHFKATISRGYNLIDKQRPLVVKTISCQYYLIISVLKEFVSLLMNRNKKKKKRENNPEKSFINYDLKIKLFK